MQVLHFAHTFIPQYGGTTTRLINLLSNEANTHYLYVPLPRPQRGKIQSTLPLEEEFGNIHVHRFKLVPKFLVKPPLVDPIARINALRMANSVKEVDVDIVHGHNPPTFAKAALYSAKNRGLPLIYEYHRLSFDSYGINRKYKLPKTLDAFLRRLNLVEESGFLKASKLIIVHTEMKRKRLVDLFGIDPNKIHVIPAGVDERRFDPLVWEKDGFAIRRSLGWQDKKVFMYNGHLSRVNGVEQFLEAIDKLPKSIKQQARFVILGGGPMKKFVDRRCQTEPELIESLGLVEYSKMPAYYSAADVVVIPLPPIMVWECSNATKMLEGMAMKKVVLGSSVAGVTELVKDGQNGIVYRKGDTTDLVRQIAYIINNFEHMDKLRNNARETVIKERCWRDCRVKLQNAYDVVIRKSDIVT